MGGVVVNKEQVRIIAMSAATASVTGTVTETALATIPIPAGIMGLNGMLRVTAAFSYTNSANNKTCRIRFGAAGAGTSGTNYHGTTATTSQSMRIMATVQNRASASSQVGSAGVNATAAGWDAAAQALVTSTVNTGAASEIVLTGTLANTGETITLESYLVELIVP